MASTINKVILIGNLGADPDLKYISNGNPVCELRLATSEQWKDKNGQKQEKTEWHRVIIWGKMAEISAKYLRKGSKVYAEGRIETRAWEDKEGNKRYTTEIKANNVGFLDKREGGNNSDRDCGPASNQSSFDAPSYDSSSDPDADIPF